jgi:hypothetical protein
MGGSTFWASLVPALLTIMLGGAGIIGTLLVVNNITKYIITAVIIVAGAITFIQSYRNSREVDFMKNALATILAHASSTPEFQDYVFHAAFEVAKKNGYWIPTSDIMDDGDMIYTLAAKGSPENNPQIGAILVVDERLKGTFYTSYANGDDLKPVIEAVIFGADTDNSDNDQREYLTDLGIICQFSLNQKLHGNKNTYTDVSIGYSPERVSCVSSQKSDFSLNLDANFIDGIKPMRRGERAAQAFAEFKKQIGQLQ